MYAIIIIGAGPAGISMAAEARTFGVPPDKILILEKAHEHSFTIKKYYPEGKLVTANYKGFEAVCTGVMCIPDLSKQETISYLDEAIKSYEIDVHYQETVYKIEKHQNEQKFSIFTDRAMYEVKVVAIAIGILGKPNKPEYKLPSSLKNRLVFDLTTNQIKNSTVLVVGGGDSASEYSQYLVQEGNKVTLSYRRQKFTRMNEINEKSIFALAKNNQVEILFGSDIAKVENTGDKPLVTFKQVELGVRGYDFIVYALGGTTPKHFLKTIGIEFVGEEPVLLDGYESSVPGLFLIGDLSAGEKGGSIIWAFNASRKAMRRICEDYLKCQSKDDKL
jgi:thioredoxin reductase (NADPH)